MNTTLNEINTARETETIPFPSHVHTSAPNPDVRAIARELVDTSRDLNNILASAGNVHNFVRAHYVDTDAGVYGIESLIAQILRENGAIFPTGIEKTEFRKVAIASSMFANDIIKIVHDTFGKERYPYATIHSYLSYFMTKPNSQHKIGKIKLSSSEDYNRHCCKPRIKFYLLEA